MAGDNKKKNSNRGTQLRVINPRRLEASPIVKDKIRAAAPSPKSVLISAVLFIFISLNGGTQKAPAGRYSDLISPDSIAPGQTFRVLITSEIPQNRVSIKAIGQSEPLAVLKQEKGGGPPYWWTATFVAKNAGIHRVWIEDETSRWTEKAFSVSQKQKIPRTDSSIWRTERAWTKRTENLYSAWIERLFLDAEEGRTWNFLHEVMRDAERNSLYNHLGLGEDESLVLDPDCADNPFFFRAYFA